MQKLDIGLNSIIKMCDVRMYNNIYKNVSSFVSYIVNINDKSSRKGL